jgi:hypothetical protein
MDPRLRISNPIGTSNIKFVDSPMDMSTSLQNGTGIHIKGFAASIPDSTTLKQVERSPMTRLVKYELPLKRVEVLSTSSMSLIYSPKLVLGYEEREGKETLLILDRDIRESESEIDAIQVQDDFIKVCQVSFIRCDFDMYEG